MDKSAKKNVFNMVLGYKEQLFCFGGIEFYWSILILLLNHKNYLSKPMMKKRKSAQIQAHMDYSCMVCRGTNYQKFLSSWSCKLC